MIKKFKDSIQIVKSRGIKRCLSNYFSILVSSTCVVSFRKSGRTWLRMMLAKALSLKYGIKNVGLETHMMTLFKSAPNVFFSHGGSSVSDKRLDFRGLLKRKRIIFLARDPRDVIVSLFHDYTKRNLHYNGGISEFIRDPNFGMDRIISFMNDWAEEMNKRKERFLLVRYEDMQKDTSKELKRVLDFLKIEVSNEVIDESVKYGSFKNMRAMEVTGEFKDHRMRPKDINDTNSYKTRKGKVGSYKEELIKEDIDYLNREVKDRLNHVFRY